MVRAEIGKKLGRDGPGPKFCILFLLEPGQNFKSSFGPGRDYRHATWAGPGSEKSGLGRPLDSITQALRNNCRYFYFESSGIISNIVLLIRTITHNQRPTFIFIYIFLQNNFHSQNILVEGKRCTFWFQLITLCFIFS